MAEHDAAIAAKAREEVLKDVVELTEAAASDNGIHQGWVLLAIVKGICKTCGNEPLRSEVKKR